MFGFGATRSSKSSVKPKRADEEEASRKKSDGVFGAQIDRDGEAHPVLCKLVRYLLGKGLQTEDIFKVQIDVSNKELQALKRKITTGTFSNNQTTDFINLHHKSQDQISLL